MALDMKGLIQRCFSIPPGGFILSDILAQIFDPSSGHNHDGVNSAVVSTSVPADGATLAITGSGTAACLGVKAGGIGTTQLGANAVTTAKIADKAVTTGQLDDKAVGAGQLADAVTGALVYTVATAPTTANAAGLYYCTADSKLYFNNGTAVVKSAALS